MIRTITNWKGLSEVMRDSTMCKNPVRIAFNDKGLESVSFAGYDDALMEDSE